VVHTVTVLSYSETEMRKNAVYYHVYCVLANILFGSLIPMFALLFFNLRTSKALGEIMRQDNIVGETVGLRRTLSATALPSQTIMRLKPVDHRPIYRCYSALAVACETVTMVSVPLPAKVKKSVDLLMEGKRRTSENDNENRRWLTATHSEPPQPASPSPTTRRKMESRLGNSQPNLAAGHRASSASHKSPMNPLTRLYSTRDESLDEGPEEAFSGCGRRGNRRSTLLTYVEISETRRKSEVKAVAADKIGLETSVKKKQPRKLVLPQISVNEKPVTVTDASDSEPSSAPFKPPDSTLEEVDEDKRKRRRRLRSLETGTPPPVALEIPETADRLRRHSG